MATVPTYGQPKAETAPLRPSTLQPRSPDYGQAEGRALQNVGKQVGAAADRLGQISVQLQVEENERQLKRADVALKTGLNHLLDGDGTPENPGYRSLNGEAALDALPQLQSRVDKLNADVAAGITGDKAKRMYSDYSPLQVEQAKSLAAAHSVKQGEAAKEQISLARIGASISSAATNYSNPMMVNDSVQAVAAEAKYLASRISQDHEFTQNKVNEAVTGVYKAAVVSAIKAGDIQEAARMMDAYDPRVDTPGGKMLGEVHADLSEALVVAQRAQLARARADQDRAVADAAVGRATEYADLRVRQIRGEDVSQEVLAFDQKYRGAKGAGAQRIQLAKASAGFQRDAALLFHGNAIMEGVVAGSPTNPDDVKAVNAVYNGAATKMLEEGADAGQVQEMGVLVAQQTGFIPERLKESIQGNGGLLSVDPDKVAAAAILLDRVNAADDRLLNQMDKQAIGVGQSVARYIQAGATPQEAVRMDKDSRKITDVQRDGRKKEFEDLIKADKPEARAAQLFAVPWGRDPAIDSVMVEQFRRIAQGEFENTGDIESAWVAASILTKRNWGVSSVSGAPRTMYRPPEKHYGLAGFSDEQNSEWMREQLVVDFTGSALFPPGAEQTLTVTASPDRAGGDAKPVYNIGFRNPETGEWIIVMGANSKPALWSPRWEESPAKARRDEELRLEEERAAMRGDTIRQSYSPESRIKTQEAINSLIVGGM